MYYVKWKGDGDWFIGMDEPCSSWGPLRKAKGFGSKAEIEKHFRDNETNHWIPKVEIIFLHPLNLAQRLKGY